MKTRHRLGARAAAATVVVALLGVVAGSASAGRTAADRQHGGPTFNVLVVTELSGPYASFGAAYRPGLLAAGHLVNQWGGILGRKVSLKFVDDQSNPVTGVSVLQNELASGTHYDLAITDLSAFTTAYAPLLAKQDLVHLNAATASSLYVNTPYKNLFGLSPNLMSQEQGVAAELKAKGVTNVGILAPTTASGVEASGLVASYAQAEGIAANIVLATPTVSDATPQLQQLQGKGAKALVVLGFGPLVYTALAARAKLGWTAPAFCDLACAASDWNRISADQRQGVQVEQMPWFVIGNPATKTRQYALFQKTLAAYEKDYALGIVVDMEAYNMLMVVRAAAAKAHSVASAKLIPTLESMTSSKSVPWYIGPAGLFASGTVAGNDWPHNIHSTARDMIWVPAAPHVKGLMPSGK